MAHNKCGTCKHLQLKIPSQYTGKPPTQGYCYGVPPFVGKIYPQMSVFDRACGCYEPKEDKGE